MTAALLCYQHKWYLVMYIAMALATVTKGPIGIVFPGAIIFLHLLFTGNLREILKMHVIRGLVVYFAIAAPWYYLMYQAHGMEFINTFLGFHNLTRFTTPEHPDRVLWWYYLPVIILGMFPWTGLLLQSIRASISEASSEELVKMSFFNIWWVFVLLFFSISQTKLVSYILPMFPALAIIIGWNLARLEKQRGESLLSWVIGTVIMFGLLGAGWLIGRQSAAGSVPGSVCAQRHNLCGRFGNHLVFMARARCYFCWLSACGNGLFNNADCIFVYFTAGCRPFQRKNNGCRICGRLRYIQAAYCR